MQLLPRPGRKPFEDAVSENLGGVGALFRPEGFHPLRGSLRHMRIRQGLRRVPRPCTRSPREISGGRALLFVRPPGHAPHGSILQGKDGINGEKRPFSERLPG